MNEGSYQFCIALRAHLARADLDAKIRYLIV